MSDPVDLNGTISSYITQTAQTVEHQTEVLKIVDDETLRLKSQADTLRHAQESSNRLIAFNQNFSKRYSEYVKMLFILFAGLAIIVIILMIGRVFPIGSSIQTVLTILILSVVVIWCIKIYSNIQMRDNIDFDQISVPPPPSKYDMKSTEIKNGNSGNLLCSVELGLCAGAQCCNTKETKWDVNSQSCVKLPEGFETEMKIPKPFTPSTPYMYI